MENYEQLLIKKLQKIALTQGYGKFLSHVHKTYLTNEKNKPIYDSLLELLKIPTDSGVNVLFNRLKMPMRNNLDYLQTTELLQRNEIQAAKRKSWPKHQMIFVMQPTVIPATEVEKMVTIPNTVRVKLMMSAIEVSKKVNEKAGAGNVHVPCIEFNGYLCRVEDVDSVNPCYLPTKEDRDAKDWEEVV